MVRISFYISEDSFIVIWVFLNINICNNYKPKWFVWIFGEKVEDL